MRIAFVYFDNVNSVGRGAGYVASAILAAGYELDFFDTYLTPVKKLAKTIILGSFDVLMISTTSIDFHQAIDLIRIVKKKCSIKVLLGGIHVTILKEKVLQTYNEIDYACVGEGEEFIIDFLKKYEQPSLFDLPNLIYRKSNEIKSNPPRPVDNLANLPVFRWDLFRHEAVINSSGVINIQVSRGCPYNCNYCSNSTYLKLYGKKYLRFRPIDDILSELKYLAKKFSAKMFYFGDEMILSRTKEAIEFFEKYKSEINLPYGCMIHPEYINEKIANILSDTGCYSIGMGVECGDENYRKKYLNRHLTNVQIVNAAFLVKNRNIKISTFNMLGLPFGEDKKLNKTTVNLNKSIAADYVQFSIFYPLPGTKLYELCLEKNLIKETHVTDYYSRSLLKGKSIFIQKIILDWKFNRLGFLFSLFFWLRKYYIFRKMFCKFL